MNILIPDSWLREYLKTNATPKDIQKCLSLCGPSIERLNEIIIPPKIEGKEGGNKKDYIYDIEVTTNRVDCYSVYGIAREAAAILPEFGFQASLKKIKELKLIKGDIPHLQIHNNPSLCHRILALKVENVTVAPSPQWLQDRLEKVGQRPLNNLVDITNYVMWEVGHPCHVFDFAKLQNKNIVIREAKKGESFITLDNKKFTTLGGEVVIDNGQGEIIDLPSIMGTANSVVSDQTTTPMFFIDDVVSSKVRFASMSHAIRTQAATIIEKDIDPESSYTAMSRMIELIKLLYPNAKISPLVDIYPHHPQHTPITINYSLFTKLIGVVIPKVRINNILKRLNFEITKNQVIPPSYRSKDIQIPEDVVEEVARIYGYHNIPSLLMSGELPSVNSSSSQFILEHKFKTSLKYLGFTEVYSYSLIDQPAPLKLSNPLSSEWVYLRDNLINSHILTINKNRGFSEEISLFEIANVYLPQEELRLIISSSTQNYSVFKGRIEAFLSDQQINLIPDIRKFTDIYYWEVPITKLISHLKPNKTYTPISKFMPIIEDFNITFKTSYHQLEQKIKQLSPLINQIELTDNYENKLTLKITFHDPARQLTKEDIIEIRQKIDKLNLA